MRYFVIPPQYDEKLSSMARFLYQFGVLLHFGIGFWMFSNRDIVPDETEFNDTSAITKPFGDAVASIDRINSFQSLIMLFGLILMGIIYILYYWFSALFCCKGIEKHKGESKDLVECLSYEQSMQEYFEIKEQIEVLKEANKGMKEKFEAKLERLGNKLKNKLKTHFNGDDAEVLKLDPMELPKQELYDFFYNKKEKLMKSSIQGLASYNMMVCLNIKL